MRNKDWRFAARTSLVFGVALVALTSCATKGYVKKEIAEARGYTDTRVGEVSASVDQVRATAEGANALAEQIAAGNYAEIASHQVQFDFDDYRLRTEAQSALDQMAAELTSHSRYVLEVRGYADATGPERYNYRLGRERADEVIRYLMTRQSVPATRVVAMSFGEESPVADNTSRDGRAQNRRVQVRVLELGAVPQQRANVVPAP